MTRATQSNGLMSGCPQKKPHMISPLADVYDAGAELANSPLLESRDDFSQRLLTS